MAMNKCPMCGLNWKRGRWACFYCGWEPIRDAEEGDDWADPDTDNPDYDED